MDKHVSQLMAKLSSTINRVEADPSFLLQGRAIGYLAAKMIYAAGQEARFLDRTSYFTPHRTAGKLRAVAAAKSRNPSIQVKPKSLPPDILGGPLV